MIVTDYPRRYVNVVAARARFGDRVDRLGTYLGKGDDAADRVVAMIAAMPKGEGWRLLERGLRGEPIPKAPLELRNFLEDAADAPAWVDWATCDRGGAVLMEAGPIGGMVLGARSLVLGYAAPAGNKPLVFSGRLKEQAARRLNETARFVQAVSRPGGMRPFADGWQITLKVRLIHAQVRAMIVATDRWRADEWGLPVNQHDMVATTLLFSVAMIDGLRKLGIRVDHDEAEDYMHLWRWTGHVIGVDAELLPASEAEATRLVDLIGATTGDPDQDSRDLTRALFDSGKIGATNPDQLRDAERRIAFGETICRELVGDDLADKLGVPRSRLRHVIPVIRQIVASAGRVTRAIPSGRERAIAAGSRYWDRVVERGMEGIGYEFPLPKGLAAA